MESAHWLSPRCADVSLEGPSADLLDLDQTQDLWWSLGLIFELVLPQSAGEGGRPHVKGRSSRQRQKEEEGHLEAKPVNQTSSRSAEGQLPQHFQRCQKTVVGCLKDNGGKEEWRSAKEEEQG